MGPPDKLTDALVVIILVLPRVAAPRYLPHFPLACFEGALGVGLCQAPATC
jgi:hypothetical protein